MHVIFIFNVQGKSGSLKAETCVTSPYVGTGPSLSLATYLSGLGTAIGLLTLPLLLLLLSHHNAFLQGPPHHLVSSVAGGHSTPWVVLSIAELVPLGYSEWTAKHK